MRKSGRKTNAERLTPRVDALLAALDSAIRPRGMKTHLARHLGATTRGQEIRWLLDFGRWRKRESLPGAETALAIEEWLAKQKPQP